MNRFRILFFWASVALCATESTRGNSLENALQTFSNPIAGRAWKVANLDLESGHSKLTLESLEIQEWLVEGQPAALYFRGRGSFAYQSVDPIEEALFDFNAKRNSSLRPVRGTAGLAIREPLKEAVIWLGGRVVAIPGPPIEKPSTFLKGAFDEFRRRNEVAGSGILRQRLLQLLIYHKASSPGLPLFALHIEGDKERLEYIYDPALTARETLRCLQGGSYCELSSQTIGWHRKSPVESLLRLSRVEIDLEAMVPKKARLIVDETLEATTLEQRILWMGLISPSERKDSPVFWLASVKDDQGRELPFIHRGGVLLFEPGEPMSPGSPKRFRFEIHGDFLLHPTDASYWKLGVFPWFPQPELAGQTYTVKAKAKVAKPYRPILPGQTVRQIEEDGAWIVETRIDQPIQFFVMDAGKFEIHENRQGDRTVRVASYMGSGRNIEKLGRMAQQYIDLYQAMLGPFPFQEFNIIQQLEYGYGQAPPGTMYITQEAFDSLSDVRDRAYSKGINQRFAHEIAHQYWGIQVKMPSLEEQWITEGFAEYCSALAMKLTKGFGEGKFREMVRHWKENALEHSSKSSIPVANQVRDLSNMVLALQARKGLIYDKSAYLLHHLHNDLGDARFSMFLQSLVRTFSWKFMTTLDVRDLATILGQKDFSPFFDKYYWGTGLP